MTTAAPSTALATIQPAFTDPERLALAGYLAGYRGLTHEAYALGPAPVHHVPRPLPEPVRRPPRRHRKLRPRSGDPRPCPGHGHPAAVHHRRGHRYAVGEELLDHSPAAHVRRPRVDYKSHAVGLDRNELGGVLVAAGLGPPAEHALISLLALNGLRVSEATGADIEHLGLERGHRTLTITRRAARWSPSRWRRGPSGRSTWPSGSGPAGRCSWPRTGGGWTGTAPGGWSARPPAAPGSPRRSRRTRSDTRSSLPRQFGRRCPATRRARGRLARRPENDDPVRPGPRQPGPARDLHRCRLCCRRRAVIREG